MTKCLLKEERLKKRFSIEELSKRSGVSRRTIYRIERELVTPRDYTMAKLKNALKEV